MTTITVGDRVTRRSGRHAIGVVVAILPATYRLPAQARVRWENTARRFSGSTHTTSTIRCDALKPAEEA